jgi:hypothetical protein
MLALAFCQCRSAAFLTVSGPLGTMGAGIGSAAGTAVKVSGAAKLAARIEGSASLSDLAARFGPNAASAWLRSGAGATAEAAGGPASLIAIAGARPSKQNSTSHTVLDNQGSCNREPDRS